MIHETITILTIKNDIDIEYAPNSPKKGQTYKGTKIQWEAGNDVKKTTVPNAFLANNPELNEQVHAFKSGDLVTLVFENTGQHKSLRKILAGEVKASPEEVAATATKSVTKAPFTPQRQGDDPARQQSIVFQSALKAAVDLSIHNASLDPSKPKKAITLDEVIELAYKIYPTSLKPGDPKTKAAPASNPNVGVDDVESSL